MLVLRENHLQAGRRNETCVSRVRGPGLAGACRGERESLRRGGTPDEGDKDVDCS